MNHEVMVATCSGPPEDLAGRRALHAAVELADGLGWPLVHARLGSAAEPSAAVRLAQRARRAVASRDPGAVVLGTGPVAREVAGRLAAGWSCALVADCCRLVVRGGVARLSRGALGNRVTAEIEWDRTGPLLLTLAPGAFEDAPGAVEPAGAEVVDLADVVEDDEVAGIMARVRILRIENLPAKEIDVRDAEVVVSGGAGAGGVDGFALLTALAERVGGAVGASRAAVDLGWIGREHQVGNTGKHVAPKVYVAVGISGASQHLAGIRSAGAVLAVNKDRRAPIFETADLGVVAPMDDVVPPLLARLETIAGDRDRLDP